VSGGEELQRSFSEMVRAFGLNDPDRTPCGQRLSVSEAHAVSELLSEPELTQGQLAERLALQKSTVSRLVGLLVERGWVERVSDDSDRRARRVNLTPSGRRVAEGVAAARARKFDRVMAAIPEEHRGSVVAALDVLNQASKKEARE